MANGQSTCLTSPPVSIGSPSRVQASPLSPSTVPSDEVLDMFQNVIRLLGELRQRSNQCRRIQRGSPGAGSLSSAIDPVKSQLNLLKSDIEAILTQYATLSCMTRLRGQYNLFDQVLNEQINEAGYDHGYSFRVYYLERLNFESGTLKGMMETVLEYWKHADKDMEHPQLHIARVLTFSDEDTTLDPLPKLNCDPIYHNGDIKVKVNLSMYMCSQYARLLNSKELCDVSFRIGTQCIQAHRIILATQSEYFEKLLFGGMSEAQNSSSEIFLKDVSVSTFELLLHYAYTGCVELDGAQLQGVLQLIEAADRFCFVHLKDVLAEKLSSFINVASVLPIFVCANQLELKELQQCCLRYADLHAREVLKQEAMLSLTANTLITLLSRDSFNVEEILVYNCVQSWMKHNSVTDYKPLLQCVRLSEIPAEQLLDLAHPYGHFTDREVISALRVQMKRQIGDMQPRGLCEKGKNLFEFKETAEINGTVSWRRAQVFLSTVPTFPTYSTIQVRPPSSTANTSAVINNERSGLQPPLGAPLLAGQAPNVQSGQPVPLQLLGQPHQPLRGLRMSSPFYNKPDCPLNQVVLIPSQNLHQPSGLFPVVQTPATVVPITVVLNNVYLLNNIEFESFPEDRKDCFRNVKFSYIIEISRDGTTWSMLFDFSSYNCFGKQNLLFPKQAIRFIKFKLSPSLLSPQLTVRLISCKLEDFHSSDFEFRKNNIIAPLHFVKPHFVEETKPFCNTSGCIATDLYFRKPISISSTQFHLEASYWPTGTVGDVVVSWGIEGGTTKEKELQNIMLSSVSSQVIQVDFGCEDVVNMMTISVKNVVIGSKDMGAQNNVLIAQKVSIKNLEVRGLTKQH